MRLSNCSSTSDHEDQLRIHTAKIMSLRIGLPQKLGDLCLSIFYVCVFAYLVVNIIRPRISLKFQWTGSLFIKTSSCMRITLSSLFYRDTYQSIVVLKVLW